MKQASDKAPFLSVVIPAYNEAVNFDGHRLENLYVYLKKQTYAFEIILVDDGSKDKTLSLLREFSRKKPEVTIIANPHKGKGPTVATGMLHARGKNRLFADFDQATPISEVEKLLPFRQKNYDVVIGSREVKGARREKEPWYRHLMGKVFNLVVKTIALSGIQDTQCGFKLFSQTATETLFPKLKVVKINKTRNDALTGAIDVELLFLANKLGYKIAEVPVNWQHVTGSKVNPLKDSARMFFEVLAIRLNDILGKY